MKEFTMICTGLAELHKRNIIHRDIKPGNILVFDDGILKISDFSLAKYDAKVKTRKEGLTRRGDTSHLFIMPEGIEWLEEQTTKADMWSAGVLLYYVCTLKYPFDDTKYDMIKTKILKGVYDEAPLMNYSDKLRRLIKALLQKDPKKRPSALEII